MSDLIAKIRATPPGSEVHLDVQSKGELRDIVIKPKPLSPSDQNSPSSIGVMLSPNLQKVEKIKAKSLPEAATLASGAVYDLTSDTARSIYGAIGGMIKGALGGGTSSGGAMKLSGPIGVIKMGSDVVRTNDFSAVATFAAAISINLAVVNSLPIPALDGGQLVFVFGEAITGRKLDQRKQEEINSLALLALLIFTFGTTVGDLTK
jgi:RIP metalloprotease RseP